MKDCTTNRNLIMLTEKPLHSDTNQNESNLGYGRASQSSLKVNRKYC